MAGSGDGAGKGVFFPKEFLLSLDISVSANDGDVNSLLKVIIDVQFTAMNVARHSFHTYVLQSRVTTSPGAV